MAAAPISVSERLRRKNMHGPRDHCLILYLMFTDALRPAPVLPR